MYFRDYKARFDEQRAALRFEAGTVQKGVGCETKVKPNLPPWIMDWAILFPDRHHIRVKETYKPKPHPDYNQGQRLHFSFQYGASTAVDQKGMPRTASDEDTIIRLDLDQWGKPHMHYGGRSHIYQEDITGTFLIAESEVFAFVEAVQTCRQSRCSMADYLSFRLKKGQPR